jgi:hypothetical protein
MEKAMQELINQNEDKEKNIYYLEGRVRKIGGGETTSKYNGGLES